MEKQEPRDLKSILEQKKREAEEQENQTFVRPTEKEMVDVNESLSSDIIEKEETIKTTNHEDVVIGKEGQSQLTVNDLQKDRNTPGQVMSNLNKYMNNLGEEVKKAEDYKRKVEEEHELKLKMKEIEKDKKETFNDEIIEVDNDEDVVETTDGVVKEKKAVDLSSIKIKKQKNENKAFNAYMSRRRETEHTTLVVLPNSGYTASIRGLSSPEIRDVTTTLGNKDNFGYYDFLYKTIHKKLFDTSIGTMDYITFLKSTALSELENILYGLFCSSYPDANTYPSQCECASKFEFSYKNVDYMDLSEEKRVNVLDAMRKVLKGQAIDPVALFESSETNSIIRKVLPSGIIVELRHPTLYNQLYDTIKNINTNDLEEVSESTLNIMPYIERVLVPDVDDEGSYLPFEDLETKMGILSTLDDEDDVALNKLISDEILSKYTISFNMRDVKCPYCGKVMDPQPVSFLPMLFTTHRIRTSAKK